MGTESPPVVDPLVELVVDPLVEEEAVVETLEGGKLEKKSAIKIEALGPLGSAKEP